MRFIDLTGQKFGKWTVIKRAENKMKLTAWLCQCNCGYVGVVCGADLRNGHSGGCRACSKAPHHLTHGLSQTRLYRIWAGMIQRCTNPKSIRYERWGGRGIKVCVEWRKEFMCFHDWAISNGYNKDLSLERINNDGSYSPSNCKWATAQEQANNTKRNRSLVIDGIQHTTAEWSRIANIPIGTIYSRLRRHWPINMLLDTPDPHRKEIGYNDYQ